MRKILITMFVLIGMVGWAQKAIIVTHTPFNWECLKSHIEARGIEVTVTDAMPDSTSLSEYDAMFYLIGVWGIDWPEGISIVDNFLTPGKSLYIAGYKDDWDNVINTYLLSKLGLTDNFGTTLTQFVYGENRYDGLSMHFPEEYYARWFEPNNPETDTAFLSDDGYPIGVEYATDTYRTACFGFFVGMYEDCDSESLNEFFDRLIDYFFLTSNISEIPNEPHTVLSVDYYDLMGRKIDKPKQGFYIERKYTDNGVVSKKIYIP